MYPTGFQIKYFRQCIHETEAEPEVSVARGMIYIPYFVETETRQDEPVEDGEEPQTRTIWKYLEVVIPYQGDKDLNDPAKLKLLRYADIRKFLYGSVVNQLEMRDDRVWDAHWAAVRKLVPNPHKNGVRIWYSRFEALTAFQEDPELFAYLVNLYTTDTTVNLWWNSSNEICLEDPKFTEIVQTVGLTEEQVQAIVNRIDNAG